MMTSTYKLQEIIEFEDGDRGTNYPKQNEFSEKGHCLFLNTTNLPDNKFDFSECQFISEGKDQMLRKGKLRSDDFILTTRGTVGHFAYYTNNNPYKNIRINSGMVILRNKSDKLYTRFLQYVLSSPSFKATVKAVSTGSAQPQLPIRDLASIKILLPSYDEQVKIFSTISAYDDLIENNEKRIRILEEMAQRLYTEWFIKYKFPGHQKVKLVDSPLGKIPANWKVKKVDELAKVIRGTSYSSEEIDDLDGDYYLVNLKSFNRGGGFRFDGVKYFNGEVKEEQLLKQGDIVVAVTDMTTDRAVISRPARIPNIRNQKITFSADVVKIVPQKIPPAFTYYTLLDYRFTETTKNKANGANVLHLKPAAISEYKILIPDKELLDEFENKCINILELKDNLNEKNEKLRKIRDLLIPQLVSGRRMLKNG